MENPEWPPTAGTIGQNAQGPGGGDGGGSGIAVTTPLTAFKDAFTKVGKNLGVI